MLGYTKSVSVDEKAYSLAEKPFSVAGVVHRFQVILVNRGDRVAEWRTDLGLWSGTAFAIPAFWEHTVGELRDMADQLRTENNPWIREQIEEARANPMGKQWLEEVEKKKAIVANRSVIGSHTRTQRSDFPRSLNG